MLYVVKQTVGKVVCSALALFKETQKLRKYNSSLYDLLCSGKKTTTKIEKLICVNS